MLRFKGISFSVFLVVSLTACQTTFAPKFDAELMPDRTFSLATTTFMTDTARFEQPDYDIDDEGELVIAGATKKWSLEFNLVAVPENGNMVVCGYWVAFGSISSYRSAVRLARNALLELDDVSVTDLGAFKGYWTEDLPGNPVNTGCVKTRNLASDADRVIDEGRIRLTNVTVKY